MEIGSSLNMAWLGDVVAVRDTIEALDESGFDYVTSSGHVLTAEAGRYADRPTLAYGATYRDPFVLFANVAASTSRIRFRTAILILPLLPTPLVAKQAADLSLLSSGRLELGVGISWQQAEYEAFGRDVRTRGRRLEEQIDLLRKLWTEPFIHFDGEFEHVDGLGIGQLPTAPIPIWIGCSPTDTLLGRVARLGDGWLPSGGLTSSEPATRIGELARDLARDPATIGVAGRVALAPGDPDAAIENARAQLAMGATGLTIVPPAEGSPEDALRAVIAAKEAIGAALSG